MKRILAIILSLIFMIAGSACAELDRLIVSGSGTVYVQADQVSACLGVTMDGEDLAVLQAQVNKIISDICTALQAEGMDADDISTNYIYINPCYDYGDGSSGAQRIVGYSVSSSITIRTSDIERIGAYIDAAFAAGANTFDSISFSLNDDREAREQALELAVQDAQSKAQIIAAAAGKAIEGIAEIREGASGSYSVSANAPRYAVAESAADGSGTTVRAAQVSVTANVEITYEMR